MHVDDEGHLIAVSKVRGRKKSLLSLVEHMEQTYSPDQNDIIFIGHGDSLEDAEFVRDLVQEKFGISNILISYIGPVIGAHSGPAPSPFSSLAPSGKTVWRSANFKTISASLAINPCYGGAYKLLLNAQITVIRVLCD